MTNTSTDTPIADAPPVKALRSLALACKCNVDAIVNTLIDDNLISPIIADEWMKQAESEADSFEWRERAEKAEAEIEHIKALLKDPSAVHINTLRGTIAGLSWDGYEHILGPHPCRERAEKAEAEVERLSKLTEDCLNVIRVYCPRFYQAAMDRFNITTK
jgi:hypothetical protein